MAINRKKFGRSGITPFYFPVRVLIKIVILGHFSQYRRQGIEQTTILLFILKVLGCSNNLMQKMTSILPFPSMKLSIRKYFSKILDQKFGPKVLTVEKDLDNTS